MTDFGDLNLQDFMLSQVEYELFFIISGCCSQTFIEDHLSIKTICQIIPSRMAI